MAISSELPKRLLYHYEGSNRLILRGLRFRCFVRPSRRALLFYKIPSVSLSKHHHTNELEIWDWVYVLNRLGYEVDLVSRSATTYLGDGAYDLFLGLGTSGSSRFFLEHAVAAQADRNIMIATTPHPNAANKARKEHLFRVRERYGLTPRVDRIDPSEGWISEHLDFVDSIMVYGIKGSFADKSFENSRLDRVTFGPSSLVTPSLPSRAVSVDPTSFVLYSGSGLLAKGADIVVETFLKNPRFCLTIYGPPEPEFMAFLESQTKRVANITYRGFHRASRRSLEQLRERVAGQILTSPSEGCASSVATLAGFGIVPIMNEEVGFPRWNDFSLGDFDERIGDRLEEMVSRFSGLSRSDLHSHRLAEFQKAQAFSREGFRASLTSALTDLHV